MLFNIQPSYKSQLEEGSTLTAQKPDPSGMKLYGVCEDVMRPGFLAEIRIRNAR